ncbi:MAG: gamma-glutamyl-gamma-aminobutyrate hydrolase family protein, partial [Pseudomonadota bacterium]
MRRPVIGIIGNSYLINDQYPAHAAGEMNAQAVADVSKALPLIVPSDPNMVCIDALMETCDGFLFTGGRPNVHPEEYGEDATEAHGTFDRA